MSKLRGEDDRKTCRGLVDLRARMIGCKKNLRSRGIIVSVLDIHCKDRMCLKITMCALKFMSEWVVCYNH